jgi:hypothetical protein
MRTKGGVMHELEAVGGSFLARRILLKLTVASAMVAFMLLLAAPARAAITSVSVVSSTQLGEFDHRDYREVTIRMIGTAPGGAYDVPVILAFPERAKDRSGVALVDVVATSTITGVLPAPSHPGPAITPVAYWATPTSSGRATRMSRSSGTSGQSTSDKSARSPLRAMPSRSSATQPTSLATLF